ncbi:MAG: ferritin-like domain-containing protein [Betaproteobacteria bacterium]
MTGLLPFLQEFYAARLSMVLAHQASARLVGQYDANNTYQYIINREEAHLSWIASAIAELGGTATAGGEPPARGGPGRGADAAHAAIQEDAALAQEFVDRWSPRVDALANARHRVMLRVILGETMEHKRFFEQALAGRNDLLGRRGEEVGPRVGQVLPTRWIE